MRRGVRWPRASRLAAPGGAEELAQRRQPRVGGVTTGARLGDQLTDTRPARQRRVAAVEATGTRRTVGQRADSFTLGDAHTVRSCAIARQRATARSCPTPSPWSSRRRASAAQAGASGIRSRASRSARTASASPVCPLKSASASARSATRSHAHGDLRMLGLPLAPNQPLGHAGKEAQHQKEPDRHGEGGPDVQAEGRAVEERHRHGDPEVPGEGLPASAHVASPAPAPASRRQTGRSDRPGCPRCDGAARDRHRSDGAAATRR